MSDSIEQLRLSDLYSFELDPFQKAAIAALNANKSVVVSAPTGSGKTLIGEYAIHRAQILSQRVFYTTPLKALSNQKFRDFQQQFGPEQVGLLTGDISISRDAPILVMTTEIYRNILYGTLLDDVSASLADVASVILDECHYMNDPQRGTVWEESIIYSPSHIQLIALSATIANADDLTDWIRWVHGPTELVISNDRPVPLRFSFVSAKGFFPLLDQQRRKINPKLKIQARGSQTRKQKRAEVPQISAVIRHLRDRDLLPAIYFIFSRKRCEKAVQAIEHLCLVTDLEKAEIQNRVQKQLAQYPNFAKPAQIDALFQGIATHHAGLLPIWKSFVEELFQLGLIKVVFATETLAAGINMPARTTVISSLSKRTDLGHRMLTASEFLQMSGRAGRRGMDKMGYVVTVQTAFEGAKEAAYLSTAKADPLVSQFTPSYGMVLNLLQTHTFHECQKLIQKSFGQYLAIKTLSPQQQAIDTLQTDLEKLQARITAVDFDEIHEYQKLQQRLKVEQKLLRTLHLQAEDLQSQILQPLECLEPGTLLGLRQRSSPEASKLGQYGIYDPLPAIFLRYLPSSGQFPLLLCLAKDNRYYLVSSQDAIAQYGKYPDSFSWDLISSPKLGKSKVGKSLPGNAETVSLADAIPSFTWEPAPEVTTQLQRVECLEQQISEHPAHSYHKQHSQLLRLERRSQSLQTQLRDRQTKLSLQVNSTWREFMALVEVLQSFDAMDENNIKPLGKIAARFRGENELWLALAFSSGDCDHLDPHHLSALVAALVTDHNRSDIWIRPQLSDEVSQTLQQLSPVKRKLIQTQRRKRVGFPVCLDVALISLVEQWALSIEWDLLCRQTNLDEGDIVRVLRRTLDVLSQISHNCDLNEELRRNSNRAKGLIQRFPLNEAMG